MFGQRLHAELARHRPAFLVGPEDVFAAAPAVVVDDFWHAVAVGIELLAPMRERVPLGGVLRPDRHRVVRHHVEQRVVLAREAEVVAELAGGAARGLDAGRPAAGYQFLAARKVQRQAEREGDAFGHFAHGCEPPRGCDKVHAADLVVGPEFTPVRPGGPVFPAHVASFEWLAGL